MTKRRTTNIPAGTRFGLLTVVGKTDRPADKKSPGTYWLCSCECGGENAYRTSVLTMGKATSCGCMKRIRPLRHGGCGTPEYKVWDGMIARCHTLSSPDFPRYGGRGITVDPRWRTFDQFFADMGPRPSRQHSLDREDNDGDYTPSNCRWATPIQQGNNKRNNVIVELNGKSMTVAQWARHTGINEGTIRDRIRRGIPAKDVLSPERADRCGENSPRARLADAQAREIWTRNHFGESAVSLAREFGVSASLAREIRRGTRYARATADLRGSYATGTALDDALAELDAGAAW